MEKIIILALLPFLISCGKKEQRITCELVHDNGTETVELYAEYDDLREIGIIRSYDLPSQPMASEKWAADLNDQLDSCFSIENDHLIENRKIILDEKYSLSETVRKLEEDHYVCR